MGVRRCIGPIPLLRVNLKGLRWVRTIELEQKTQMPEQLKISYMVRYGWDGGNKSDCDVPLPAHMANLSLTRGSR